MTYKETVVVSASKTEQQLVDAPATMTVIGPRALSVAPSNNYADLLRNVPGVNVTQISARDVNVTSRERDELAGDVAAGGPRRAKHLPGLLRVHDVGLHARRTSMRSSASR